MPDTMRHVYTSSSCGICGTDSIEAVRKTIHFDPPRTTLQVPVDVLAELPERLREAQAVFDRTGGVHAADCSGWMAPARSCFASGGRRPAQRRGQSGGMGAAAGPAALELAVLQVSGRASFELVQKAAMAGIPVLSAVSAPSSLAVDLAAETGVTLVGFSRGHSLNVYAGRDGWPSHKRTLPEPARQHVNKAGSMV